ncbi:MAG: hypothetical protein AB2L24_24020 [Mangrovibacterium sp.]
MNAKINVSFSPSKGGNGKIIGINDYFLPEVVAVSGIVVIALRQLGHEIDRKLNAACYQFSSNENRYDFRKLAVRKGNDKIDVSL